MKKIVPANSYGCRSHNSRPRHHLRPRSAVPLLLCVLSLALNAAARADTDFADWYQTYVFPLWVETYGRITGLAPFSVGEFLILAGILWLTVLAVWALVLAIRALLRLLRRLLRDDDTPVCMKPDISESLRKPNLPGCQEPTVPPGPRSAEKPAHLSAWRRFLLATAWILSIVFLIQTLNCFIAYQATGIPEPSLTEEERERRYSSEALAALRDEIVEKCNTLASEVLRNEDGTVKFGGSDSVPDQSSDGGAVSASVRNEIAEEVISCMHRLSAEYPALEGWYPRPKGMLFSHLMSQMSMEGYYFPFSMEANYNTDMTVCSYAPCMAHELSHLKGYLQEDDCNYLGFLACLTSDDPSIVYSGYLSVLNYVDNDFYASIGKDRAVYLTHPEISDQVRSDNTYLVPSIKEEIEKASPLDTKAVTQATKSATDASLRANGVKEGWNSYNLVVRHLLDWYADQS